MADPSAERKSLREQMIALRKQGLLNPQIADELGLTDRIVATELYRAKKAGMKVPKSPYSKRKS